MTFELFYFFDTLNHIEGKNPIRNRIVYFLLKKFKQMELSTYESN